MDDDIETGTTTSVDIPAAEIGEAAGQATDSADTTTDTADPFAGIPTQAEYDTQAMRQAIANLRQEHAAAKVNWQIAVSAGMKGAHPNQFKEEAQKSAKATERLETFLLQGSLPTPTDLEIVSEGLAVAKAISKPRRGPPPRDVA